MFKIESAIENFINFDVFQIQCVSSNSRLSDLWQNEQKPNLIMIVTLEILNISY
jgi:hypothetical protein